MRGADRATRPAARRPLHRRCFRKRRNSSPTRHLCTKEFTSWNIDALGASGLKVPCTSASAPAPSAAPARCSAHWGTTDAAEARRLVDICLEAGVNLFDTADVYSERRLGDGARRGDQGPARPGARSRPRRSLPMGDGPNDAGSSRLAADQGGRRRAAAARHRLYRPAATARLRRRARRSRRCCRRSTTWCAPGKLRYVGVSNFSGWQLMKSLGARRPAWLAALCRASGLLLAGRARLRMGADAARASTRASARSSGARSAGAASTGKIRRGQPLPEGSRLHETARASAPPVDDEQLYRIVDVLDDRWRRPARPCRRSPSTGCCSARRCPR